MFAPEKFDEFLRERMIIDQRLSVDIQLIKAAWIMWTNNTVGQKHLIDHIRDTRGFMEMKKKIIGMSLKPISYNTPDIVTVPMTEYEKGMLEIEREKIAAEREKTSEKKNTKIMLQDREHQFIREIKDKEMAFQREENNKNRAIFSPEKANRYLDPVVYGTPTQKFITAESFVDNVAFRRFKATGDVEWDGEEELKKIVMDNAELQPVRTPDGNDEAKLLFLTMQTAKDIAKKLNSGEVTMFPKGCLDTFIERLEEADKCLRTNYSSMLTEVEYLERTNKEDKKTNKHYRNPLKEAYIRSCNKAYRDKSGKLHVKCTCCDTVLPIDSPDLDRGHDYPDSKGGSWCPSNIYLVCKPCNLSMSNKKTVSECLAEIYGKRRADTITNKPVGRLEYTAQAVDVEEVE